MKHWLKALRLFFTLFLTGIAAGFLFFWLSLFTTLILSFTSLFVLAPNSGFTWSLVFFVVFGFTVLMVSVGIYFLLLKIYSWVLRLLWDNPPQWTSPPGKFRHELSHLAVGLLSLVPVALLYLAFLFVLSGGSYKAFAMFLLHSLTRESMIPITTNFFTKVMWLFIPAAAFLYMLEAQSNKRALLTKKKSNKC
jgi:hypothetical protein